MRQKSGRYSGNFAYTKCFHDIVLTSVKALFLEHDDNFTSVLYYPPSPPGQLYRGSAGEIPAEAGVVRAAVSGCSPAAIRRLSRLLFTRRPAPRLAISVSGRPGCSRRGESCHCRRRRRPRRPAAPVLWHRPAERRSTGRRSCREVVLMLHKQTLNG